MSERPLGIEASNVPAVELYEVNAEGRKYNLWLPWATTDHIQKSVASSGSPYEGAMLAASLQWLDPESMVVDVGGNIGNHAVFWGINGHVVVMFEPDASSFRVAAANIQINGLTDRVQLHPVALGDRPGRGRCENDSEGNSGATRVILDSDGEVIVRTLDSYELDGVGLVKVDVEGMEPAVLDGGRRTIERERPVLLVETLRLEEIRALVERMIPLGYVHWETFNASPTQLFIPMERLNDSMLAEHTGRLAVERFKAAFETQARLADLERANQKYRMAVQQIDTLKERLTIRGRAVEQNRDAEALAAKDAEIEAVSARLAHMGASYERLLSLNSELTEQVALLSESVRAGRQAAADEKLALVRELDDARKHAAEQTARWESAVSARELESVEMFGELARLREMLGDAWTKHAEAISKFENLQHELAAQSSAYADQLAGLKELVGTANAQRDEAVSRAAELTDSLRRTEREHDQAVDRVSELIETLGQTAAARDDAASRAEQLAAELQSSKLEKEQLRSEISTARARLRELTESNSRRAEDLRALGESIRVHEQTIAGLHADKIRMARRLRDVGRERAELKRRIEAIRTSRSYQIGRLVREGLASPSTLLKLPGHVARAARGRRSEVVSTQVPRQIEGGGSRGPALAPIPSSTKPGFMLPRIKENAAGPEFLLPPRSDVRVASILDEFSYACFAPEADIMQLTPENWREELEKHSPDLLLVESAWRGKNGLWRNMVAKCGPEIVGILEWCKSRGVPTAFWNKEDPVHFSAHLTLAAQFDAVFTTDVDCIPRYKQQLGHERVYFLPFAAQPRLHNPLEAYTRADAFAFAGAYYTRYPERTADLESFVKELPTVKDVVIFDRMYGQDDPQYKFPEAYDEHIVGRLEPDEIQVAYKGYSAGINLNSVKGSQSMFARRVFELMASNTLVVSNFSPALSLMFGDLIVATDSGRRVVQVLEDLAGDPQGESRLRAQAVRKVLREHTYDDRLAEICKRLGIDRESSRGRVAVVAVASSAKDVAAVREAVERQSTVPSLVVLLTDTEGCDTWGDVEVLIVDSGANEGRPLEDFIGDTTHVAMFNARDYYGRCYLEDLVLAGRYSAAGAVGKAGAFHVANGILSRSSVDEYVAADSLPLRRALVERAEVAPLRIGDLVEGSDERHSRSALQLQIDGFEYAQDSVDVPLTELSRANASLAREGRDLESLVRYADASEPSAEVSDAREDQLSWFVDMFAGVTGPIRVTYDGEYATVRSTLDSGTHSYAYAPDRVLAKELGWKDQGVVYLDVGPGLDLQLAILFFSADGQRISHAMATANRNHRFNVPVGTVEVGFGLRASGPGELRMRRLVTREVVQQTAGLMSLGSTIVLTNVYPSYDNLYRNGFVHSRVMAYRESGLDVDVVLLADVASPRFREFEGVRVIEMSASELTRMLRRNRVTSVLVHFLDADMWDVVRDPALGARVHVWVHGSEVQPWWRRQYNALTEAELDKAKLASAVRVAFWQEVFSHLPEHVDFVFVSRYFAEEVMADVGVDLPSDRFRIIHNPIDDDLFQYDAKPDEMRRKILSIRPYASRKYANDLSVAAVLALRDEPFFGDLEFCFVGDGPLFDEVLEPIREFPNVRCEKRFLTRTEIAEMHRQYGVFLSPTRMDAQGVSRDEAMASGLVPLSSDVAAVPEFVDETTGILAPAEDHIGLANGIAALAKDPALFRRLSRNAAARVRRQSAKSVVLGQELKLIEGRDE